MSRISLRSYVFFSQNQEIGSQWRNHQPGDPALPAAGVCGCQRHQERRPEEAASLQHEGERLTAYPPQLVNSYKTSVETEFKCPPAFPTWEPRVCHFECSSPGRLSEGQVGPWLQAKLQPLQKHLGGCGPTASEKDGQTEVRKQGARVYTSP